MKHLYFLIFLLFLYSNHYAQTNESYCSDPGCYYNYCGFSGEYGGDFGELGCGPSSQPVCDFTGWYPGLILAPSQYASMDVVSGKDYQFIVAGVSPSDYDFRITGYNSSNTSTPIFWNDDFSSIDVKPVIDWTASFTGTLYVQVNKTTSGCGCGWDGANSAVLNVRELGKDTPYWFGFEDREWDNPNNWCAGVPNTSDNVIIPNTDQHGSNYPIIRNGVTGNCNTIEIHSDNNANVEIETGGTLNVTQ